MVAAVDWFERPARLFTREEYHAMAENGILKPDDKVELIEGRIINMFPLGPWHISNTEWLDEELRLHYGKTAHVFLNGALLLPNNSEPQPDVMVVHRREDRYRSALPRPEDVMLLIEVSDSSRAFDLEAKHDLYASNKIPEYWVVDEKLKAIHVFRDPMDGTYGSKQIYKAGEHIPLPHCDGAKLCASELG